METHTSYFYLVFEAVARQSHDRANLARRNGVPGFRDVMTSCEEMGIGPAGLTREMRRSKLGLEESGGEWRLLWRWIDGMVMVGLMMVFIGLEVEPPNLEIKYARRAVTPPAEVLLPSDDEEDGPHTTVMKTKDSYGVGFLPDLPCRHAYRQTPVRAAQSFYFIRRSLVVVFAHF